MANKEKINKEDPLAKMRHSGAHLLAAAVQNLYPDVKLAIGPAIDYGFYYDFDFGDTKISEKDFPAIEKEMERLKNQKLSFEKVEMTIQEGKKFLSDKNQPYSLSLLEDIENLGSTVKEEQTHEKKKGKEDTVTFYKNGDFINLCRGGHVENFGEIGVFKITSVAGAYFRGSEKNPMLTRIYVACFPTQKELDNYLIMQEEAKKRDHRKIAQDLELYIISEEVGPGLPIWLPKGAILKDLLESLAKQTEKEYHYERILSPVLSKDSLFYQSGHLPYYKDDMFPPMKVEGIEYYLKPMNCPFAHVAFKTKKRSYKELPVRYAELGLVHRYEESGTLMGLMRVREITQNDAHIYCTEDQALDEIKKVMDLHKYYYNLFDITDYYIELALPDFVNKKDKYFDDPDGWEKSIGILRKAAQEIDIPVIEKEGGAAFYAPKFDFNIKSAIGREFGASTNQLDFGSSKRFDLTYIDDQGQDKLVDYVIHRAPLGSSERFIGFLLEHFAGHFPFWLAPVQVKILTLNDQVLEYVKTIQELLDCVVLMQPLKYNLLRYEIDNRSETLGKKIREAELQKIPLLFIIGPKDVEAGEVSIRMKDKQEKVKLEQLKDFIEAIH